jgi:hypothetical protein
MRYDSRKRRLRSEEERARSRKARVIEVTGSITQERIVAEETQTAYAKSQWTDPTNLAAMAQIAVGLVALPEVTKIIPLSWMPAILAISGGTSFVLRTWKATHPVANIAPGEVKPVEVKKLEATQQGSETTTTITPPPKAA